MSRALLIVGGTVALAAAGALAWSMRAQSGPDAWTEDPPATPDEGGQWMDFTLPEMPALPALGSADDGAGGSVLDPVLNVAYQAGSVFFGRRMNISIAGLDQIKEHEALRLSVYLDQAGRPTIGYGHLIGPFESFTTITEERALELLVSDLATAESAVNALVKVAITQEQYDALVSFVFNVGAGAFRSSTLLRLLNAGDVAGAAAQFTRWNKVRVGSQLVASAGLTNRRAAEAALFSGVTA